MLDGECCGVRRLEGELKENGVRTKGEGGRRGGKDVGTSKGVDK